MADHGQPDETSGSDTGSGPVPAPTAAPRKPQIGDTRPAPPPAPKASGGDDSAGSRSDGLSASAKRRRRRNRSRSGSGSGAAGAKSAGGTAGNGAAGAPRPTQKSAPTAAGKETTATGKESGGQPASARSGNRSARRRGKATPKPKPVEAVTSDEPVELSDDALEQRRGKARNGQPVGRYSMVVHQHAEATQIAVLEGRSLLEFYVSRPTDDVNLIHGNIYLGRVQNVLPGMEAAFVDIGTPKNAVLYRGDVHYDPDDVESKGDAPRIEDVLKAKQSILCQVTKNPIGVKGARLTQEISLPGRFVVLVPNSTTFGISKRLSDNERKRLRSILDRVKPKQHGVIIRTAAEGITGEEIERDVRRLLSQWEQIEALANGSRAPTLLYREPDMAVRVIREEFNKDYRKVIIDDRALYEEVREYVASVSPALADRVEYYDPEREPLPVFERYHVYEQLQKALDRKVWLPSGGSLIIDHTEALTVIDVNTGKNVGKSNLEDTVFKNNLEAAQEIAKQLRLRDIGGIIVIDFIDMEIRKNRDEVVRVFREALARDKTRTQVFEISDLGLVEMTRKRIGEGLLVSFADECPHCAGRGMILDASLLG
jgi:ribonuclease E